MILYNLCRFRNGFICGRIHTSGTIHSKFLHLDDKELYEFGINRSNRFGEKDFKVIRNRFLNIIGTTLTNMPIVYNCPFTYPPQSDYYSCNKHDDM